MIFVIACCLMISLAITAAIVSSAIWLARRGHRPRNGPTVAEMAAARQEFDAAAARQQYAATAGLYDSAQNALRDGSAIAQSLAAEAVAQQANRSSSRLSDRISELVDEIQQERTASPTASPDMENYGVTPQINTSTTSDVTPERVYANMRQAITEARLSGRDRVLREFSSLHYRGVWSRSLRYVRGDTVMYAGSIYVCTSPVVGVVPGTSMYSKYWALAEDNESVVAHIVDAYNRARGRPVTDTAAPAPEPTSPPEPAPPATQERQFRTIRVIPIELPPEETE